MNEPGPPSAAEVVLRSLDVLEVVLAAGGDVTTGVENAKSMLLGLDEGALRRVAAYLAGAAVRGLSARQDPVPVSRALQPWRLEAIAQMPSVRPDAKSGECG